MAQVAGDPSFGHGVGADTTCPVRTVECLSPEEAQTGESQIR